MNWIGCLNTTIRNVILSNMLLFKIEQDERRNGVIRQPILCLWVYFIKMNLHENEICPCLWIDIVGCNK